MNDLNTSSDLNDDDFRAVTEVSQFEWDNFKNSKKIDQESLDKLRKDFKDAKRHW